jgi:hypothetical protein
LSRRPAMLLYCVRVHDGLPDVSSAGGRLTADIIQTNHISMYLTLRGVLSGSGRWVLAGH